MPPRPSRPSYGALGGPRSAPAATGHPPACTPASGGLQLGPQGVAAVGVPTQIITRSAQCIVGASHSTVGASQMYMVSLPSCPPAQNSPPPTHTHNCPTHIPDTLAPPGPSCTTSPPTHPPTHLPPHTFLTPLPPQALHALPLPPPTHPRTCPPPHS